MFSVCWDTHKSRSVYHSWLPYHCNLHGSGAMLSSETDPKLPTWDGQWGSFTDYVTRVELKADGTKEDELGLLGPRLASNLTNRAFDWLGEVDRAKLKEKDGYKYLLTFLESKRGQSKLDILGDVFAEFFLRKEAHRKDGEDLAEYETRFRVLMRKLDKAMTNSGSGTGLPSEVYGWFLLNVFIRLDPSDTANVRGRTEDYKVESVWAALHRMWSGGGLVQRDQENKKKNVNVSRTYVLDDEDNYPEDDEPLPEPDDLEDAATWYQDAQQQLTEEPDNGEILANFKEARRALDRARTARGFYPTRQPGRNSNRQNGTPSTGSSECANKICMRCGKKGHIAKFCRQKLGSPDTKPKNGTVNFVGFGTPMVERVDHLMQTEETAYVATSYDDGTPSEETSMICFNMDELTRGKAILDSGASDNIVGAETLQNLSEVLEEMDFEPGQEITVDRSIHKKFMFGNNQVSAGLGLGHINTGINGKEMKIQAHVVEGATPFLLSSKFLYDMEAVVDFRTGKAVFHALSEDAIQLERTPNHHLLLPLTAFAGKLAMMNSAVTSSGSLRTECEGEAQSSEAIAMVDSTADDSPKGTE